MSDLPNVAAPKDFQVGETIAGRYRLDRILGVGGMGLVFAATHLELEQVVAVKFIRAGLASAEARSRFLREARAVVKLRSEHVARVLDAGTLESGDSYMVMEYLEGTDLAVHLKACGTLPVEEASAYVLQAAEGHKMMVPHPLVYSKCLAPGLLGPVGASHELEPDLHPTGPSAGGIERRSPWEPDCHLIWNEHRRPKTHSSARGGLICHQAIDDRILIDQLSCL